LTQPGGGRREPLATRLLAAFIDEIGEHQRALVAEALALERDPANSERQSAVFRIMHTLKGAARAASIPGVESLCHAIESELAQVRSRGAPLNPQQISVLLAAADALADVANQLKAGRAAPDGPIAALLHRIAGSRSASQRDVVAVPAQRPASAVAAFVPQVVQPVPPAVSASEPESESEPESDSEPESVPVPVAGDEQVRIGADQLDSLFSTAGELLGLAARMERYPTLLSQSSRTSTEVSSDGGIQTIARRIGGDINSLRTLSSRLLQSVRHLQQSPFSDAVEMLPRTIRDIAVSLGKSAVLVVEGGDIEAERGVLDTLREPLMHLARNAVDHGLELPAIRSAAGKSEEGQVVVSARVRGDRLRVTVADDGRGIDIPAIRRRLAAQGLKVSDDDRRVARAIFSEGFSSRDQVDAISGRGVGLSIVKEAVEKIGGSVDVEWTKGKGTKIVLDVPVSVAITRALIVDVGGYQAALPSAFVDRIERITPDRINTLNGQSVVDGGGAPVPLVSLASRLGEPFAADPGEGNSFVAVWLSALSQRLTVVVRDVLDERELVLRPIPFGGGGDLVAGAALLPEGDVAIVLDVPGLIGDDETTGEITFSAAAGQRAHNILVVDDSITTRTLEASVLNASGFRVTTAVDGAEAWKLIQGGTFDLVVSDVQMPKMDGLELCRRIRSTPRFAKLPLILVTSLDQPGEKMQGMEAGADAYITKSSFDQETLLETIRQLVGKAVRK